MHQHPHHSCSHEHHHQHPGGHAAHGAPALSRTLLAGILLNAGFVCAESVIGWWANSAALLADAAHNLGDVLGLGLSLLAVALGSRQPTARLTWGYRRSSVLVALVQALALLALVGFTVWEGLERLLTPTPVHSTAIIITALIGIGINSATAMMLHRHDQNDLNVRGAFLHMIGDAAVSAAVVVSGVIISYTAWFWIDPVISFVIAGVILTSTWGLLIKSFALNMDAVPAHLNLSDISDALMTLPEVKEVHHLHVWHTSTTAVALTAHLVSPVTGGADELLQKAAQLLREKFGISHSTLQVESKILSENCSDCS